MAESRPQNELTIVGRLVKMSDVFKRKGGTAEIITIRLEQDGKYPNSVEIDFFNDRIDDVLLFEDTMGVEVRVRGSVNGRVWKKDEESEEKVFMSIIGWSIKLASMPETGTTRRKKSQIVESEDNIPGEKEEDLPTGELPGEEKPKGRKTKSQEIKETEKEDDVPF